MKLKIDIWKKLIQTTETTKLLKLKMTLKTENITWTIIKNMNKHYNISDIKKTPWVNNLTLTDMCACG